MFQSLVIQSPKRNGRAQGGWEGFFPYYAGFPVSFAQSLLSSAKLPDKAVVLDPWNGSGTTTYVSSLLGLSSQGLDLNPVMVIVAKARLLPPTEADSIRPLGLEIVRAAANDSDQLDPADPLNDWFSPKSARYIRAIEASLHHHLVGGLGVNVVATNFDNLSGLAATNYVALFSVCRDLTSAFQSSNPTWVKRAKPGDVKVRVSNRRFAETFISKLEGMAAALVADRALRHRGQEVPEIKNADSTTTRLRPHSVDIILTSPPYCTRIDYTAATRVELALLHPRLSASSDLGAHMIGTTRVPKRDIEISPTWGNRCRTFLNAVRRHPSKASGGYYYVTHLDYFDKMSRSLGTLSKAIREGGAAILVVQDSFYKDVHNDLPSIVADMAEAQGLQLVRRENFQISRSMAGINRRTRIYRQRASAVEAVLCFHKPR